MRNRTILTAVAGLLLVVLCGCQKQTVYHQFRHIADPGWDKTDTLHFGVAPLSADGDYCLDVQLRTDKDYPFQQLTLEVEQTVYPSKERYHDFVECRLVSETGIIEGDGISYFQYQFHVRDLRLQQGDSIHICLTHNMKREIMPSIADVGVCLKKTGVRKDQ